MSNNRYSDKLTPAETKRLEHAIRENGGQVKLAAAFNVTPATVSRILNRHNSPSNQLRQKLVDVGVIKK